MWKINNYTLRLQGNGYSFEKVLPDPFVQLWRYLTNDSSNVVIWSLEFVAGRSYKEFLERIFVEKSTEVAKYEEKS